MRSVEICLATENVTLLKNNIRIAVQGGAQRVELCSAMHLDGLTPDVEAIKAAGQTANDQIETVVMIRPRSGDFCYDYQEIALMQEQIKHVADAGASGAVFGGLMQGAREIDLNAMEKLIPVCREYSLRSTFHRAFDVLTDRSKSLQQLVELGFDRLLTSGTSWGSGQGAEQGLDVITKTIELAARRIEIVIGGGVTMENADSLSFAFGSADPRLSLHAYSGAHTGKHTDLNKVKALVYGQ